MLTAKVVRTLGYENGEHQGHEDIGEFQFAILPCAGDLLAMERLTSEPFFTVVRICHYPFKAGYTANDYEHSHRQGPEVEIIVKSDAGW